MEDNLPDQEVGDGGEQSEQRDTENEWENYYKLVKTSGMGSNSGHSSQGCSFCNARW
jgi:hypothetical protein